MSVSNKMPRIFAVFHNCDLKKPEKPIYTKDSMQYDTYVDKETKAKKTKFTFRNKVCQLLAIK